MFCNESCKSISLTVICVVLEGITKCDLAGQEPGSKIAYLLYVHFDEKFACSDLGEDSVGKNVLTIENFSINSFVYVWEVCRY